jgi:DNA invertase Pin-like site-specific DNA recombinase
MRRAVVYLRVSTIDQTTANQERELREIAGRMGCEIVTVYKDHGISGTRGRDKRPAFDKLCHDAARREFDVVMAWRNLPRRRIAPGFIRYYACSNGYCHGAGAIAAGEPK